MIFLAIAIGLVIFCAAWYFIDRKKKKETETDMKISAEVILNRIEFAHRINELIQLREDIEEWEVDYAGKVEGGIYQKYRARLLRKIESKRLLFQKRS